MAKNQEFLYKQCTIALDSSILASSQHGDASLSTFLSICRGVKASPLALSLALGKTGFSKLLELVRQGRRQSMLLTHYVSLQMLLYLFNENISQRLFSTSHIQLSSEDEPIFNNDESFDESFNNDEANRPPCLNTQNLSVSSSASSSYAHTQYENVSSGINVKYINYKEELLRKDLIKCVREEPGYKGKIRTYAMPMYDELTGQCKGGAPILYTVNEQSHVSCTCKLASKAREHIRTNVSGLEDNICYHERLVQPGGDFRKILNKMESPPQHTSWYLILLDTKKGDAEDAFFVYVNAQTNTGRHPGALVSLSPGHLKCSVCQRGAKQTPEESKKCPHTKVILETINIETPATPCIRRMKLKYESITKKKDSAMKYDTDENIWVEESLSYQIEKENKKKFGLKPRNVERDIEDQIFNGNCEFGAPTFNEQPLLNLFPKLPSFATPLFETCSCVYNDEVS